jgi:hypothetical protein
MARNTGTGKGRVGFVSGRWQFQAEDGSWVKVDEDDRVVGIKRGAPFKGVRKR